MPAWPGRGSVHDADVRQRALPPVEAVSGLLEQLDQVDAGDALQFLGAGQPGQRGGVHGRQEEVLEGVPRARVNSTYARAEEGHAPAPRHGSRAVRDRRRP
jgi:hypothetical protein